MLKIDCIAFQATWMTEWRPMLPGHSAYWTWQAMQFAWAHLLAEKRYLARVPLIASRRIARNPRQRQANKALRSLLNANNTLHRIPQSVCICPLYGVSDVFFLPFAVCTSGFLSKRKKLVIRSLRNLDCRFSRRMQRNESSCLSYIKGNMRVLQQGLFIVDFRDSKKLFRPISLLHYLCASRIGSLNVLFVESIHVTNLKSLEIFTKQNPNWPS